jgi:signal recognition particle receptor subunit beta
MPYVVAANKQDQENAWSPDEVRLALRLPKEIKVLPCIAREKEQVKNVLLELLYTILAVAED